MVAEYLGCIRSRKLSPNWTESSPEMNFEFYRFADRGPIELRAVNSVNEARKTWQFTYPRRSSPCVAGIRRSSIDLGKVGLSAPSPLTPLLANFIGAAVCYFASACYFFQILAAAIL